MKTDLFFEFNYAIQREEEAEEQLHIRSEEVAKHKKALIEKLCTLDGDHREKNNGEHLFVEGYHVYKVGYSDFLQITVDKGEIIDVSPFEPTKIDIRE